MYNFYKSYQFILIILAFINVNLGYAHSPVIHVEEGTAVSNFTSLYAPEIKVDISAPNKTKIYVVEGSLFNFKNNLHAQIVYLQSKKPRTKALSQHIENQNNKTSKLHSIGFPFSRYPLHYLNPTNYLVSTPTPTYTSKEVIHAYKDKRKTNIALTYNYQNTNLYNKLMAYEPTSSYKKSVLSPKSPLAP